MRRLREVAVAFCLGFWGQALCAQEAGQLVVGAIRTRAADPGGIWVLRGGGGAWYPHVVAGTAGLRHNPASLAMDPMDPELFYVGTYGRREGGQLGPCHVQRLRIVHGRLAEQVTLNAEPLDEDYLLAVVPLGDSIYYLGRRSLGRVMRSGGAAETLITVPSWVDLRGMATDGRNLFVIITARDIVQIRLRNLAHITQLASIPGNTNGEELRNLSVDREGHVMAVTTSWTGSAHLYRFHAASGKVLNKVPLPMAGARAVVQDPETGDVFVSGGVSNQQSAVVRLSGWQVQAPVVAGIPQALPALLVRQPQPFFTHGTGCPDQGGRVPRTTAMSPLMGGRAMARLSGPSNQPVALLAGRHVDQVDARLPIDLAVLGAPGCRLDLSHFAAVAGRTDAAGSASLWFAVPPNETALPYWMRVQWVALAPAANQAGLVVSPSATVVFRAE